MVLSTFSPMNARAAILLMAVGAALLSGCHPYVPERVTTDGLLALERGMTYGEVEALVGPPVCVTNAYRTEPTGEEIQTTRAFVDACGPPWRPMPLPSTLRRESFSVSYAEPRTHAKLKIYLHFNRGIFSSLYIKVDNLGICCMAHDDERARGSDGQYTGPFYGSGSRALLYELIGR